MPVAIKNDKLIDTLSGHFVKSYSTGYALSNAVSMYLALPRLLAFWSYSSYDENSDMYDLSGQGRVMTNNNTVGVTGMQGVIPYADFVRASSESFSRPDETGTSITGSLALALWCYFDTESTGNLTGLVSKWLESAVGPINKRSYTLYKSAANAFTFSVSDNGTNVFTVTSSVSYAISQWYFIAARYLPSTSLSIFVNGTWDTNAVAIPASIYNNDRPLYIGAHNEANFLDGRMALTALHRLSNNNYPTVIESLYHHTRPLFGVRS
jgi:hypothetical protein